MGGKLIAIPVDKRHKTIVSNNSFKKSYEIKLKFDIKRLLIKLKGIAFLLNIKKTKKDKENKQKQNKAKLSDRSYSMPPRSRSVVINSLICRKSEITSS